MRKRIDKVTQGQSLREMFFVPPRHGKTEQNTVHYAAFRIIQAPETRVIIAAYNQSLACTFSRKVRRLVQSFIPLSTEVKSVEHWETQHGGGVRAAGVGSGVTGLGADLIIIDDPVKSREEADSQSYRDRCWDWYTDDLWTRQEPGCAIILTMTRWHEDDLAGRLTESEAEHFHTTILPAIAEENDPLGRDPGQVLCPERMTLERIETAKEQSPSTFYALYQQRPQPESGIFFPVDNLRPYKDESEVPVCESYVRYWDKASTEGAGDYSAGVLMGRLGRQYYVLDVVRGQWSYGERNLRMKQCAFHDNQKYGLVTTWVEQESGTSGGEAAHINIADLAGYSVRADKVTGSKASRARPLADQIEAKNVFVVKTKQRASDRPGTTWQSGFLDELAKFPTGKNDDQVDAASGAFNKLALRSPLRFS